MINIPNKYCIDLHNYERFPTRAVKVGDVIIGACNPIRLQSMTNFPIQDLDNTVIQAKSIFDAGADFVRISTPRIMDVENLKFIKAKLIADGYKKPLIADVHFNPKIAEQAARFVEKVRINPGNYIDKSGRNNKIYSELEYNLELEKIHDRIKPLINICKLYGTAIRIGSNHGSLSGRIISKYGNTVDGMVEAALEYLDIFIAESFYNIVVSMKSSNTDTMIKASRLLNARMLEKSIVFPQHLGVTEAGNGDEGRLKSALGISALLSDGIGDTIRVSLTEAPEKEIPFAKKIVSFFDGRDFKLQNPSKTDISYNPFMIQKNVGKTSVFLDDYIVVGDTEEANLIFLNQLQEINPDFNYLMPYLQIKDINLPDNVFPLIDFKDISKANSLSYKHFFIKLNAFDFKKLDFQLFKDFKQVSFVLDISSDFAVGEVRYVHNILREYDFNFPVILKYNFENLDKENIIAEAGVVLGSILSDRLVSGLFLNINNKEIDVVDLSYSLLQFSGLKITKAEFISCPSCGRTVYDIEKVCANVKSAFKHLKSYKIAVMGCLVNGLGEMEDADFGCIGSKQNHVHIYKGKELVVKNVHEDDVVDELKKIIKKL